MDEIPQPKNTLLFFPNPTNGRITISDENMAKTSVEVYDRLGVFIGAFEILSGKVDLSFLPNGVYLLKATNKLARCVITH